MNSPRGPLTGIRVVDLTHVWSGPMATRALAGLGADVIKLESPAKPDALRGTSTDIKSRFPDFTPGPQALNRNAWFNTQNVDKRGVVLDLKDDRGLEQAYDLVRIADLVIANYRPGVLDRMGLGYDQLRQINPKIVLVEMPGYTADSPMASAPAFGAQFDAQSGSASLTGSPDAPLLTGFALGDPLAGMLAASGAIAALVRARKSGDGAHIVLAQSEAMMALFGEYFLGESLGQPIQEELNADRRRAPHGIYECSDASWLAISIESDLQWSALIKEMGDAADNLSADWTEVERRAHDEQIGSVLVAYAKNVSNASEAAIAFQQAGVPAAPVNGARELTEDTHLADHEVLRELDHPSAGTHRYQALPTLVDGQRMGCRTPAPRYGEHSREVLQETLGLTPGAVDELVEAGVCRTMDEPSLTTQLHA